MTEVKEETKPQSLEVDVYIGSEFESGPWYIKKLEDGQIIIPRYSPKYVEMLTELAESKTCLIYKRIFTELDRAKGESAKYLEGVKNFEENKARTEGAEEIV